MAIMTEKLLFSLNPDDDSDSELDSEQEEKQKKKEKIGGKILKK
jgi:hypothetical protein